jgi:predicted RNA-binding Zn ribbon-like protein
MTERDEATLLALLNSTPWSTACRSTRWATTWPLGLDGRGEPAGGRAVLARAALTLAELRVARPGRLRACANDERSLFLLGRNKSNNGRWCSMAACGNRLKARRRHQRILQG